MGDGKFCFYVAPYNDVRYLVITSMDSFWKDKSRINLFDYTVS